MVMVKNTKFATLVVMSAESWPTGYGDDNELASWQDIVELEKLATEGLKDGFEMLQYSYGYETLDGRLVFGVDSYDIEGITYWHNKVSIYSTDDYDRQEELLFELTYSATGDMVGEYIAETDEASDPIDQAIVLEQILDICRVVTIDEALEEDEIMVVSQIMQLVKARQSDEPVTLASEIEMSEAINRLIDGNEANALVVCSKSSIFETANKAVLHVTSYEQYQPQPIEDYLPKLEIILVEPLEGIQTRFLLPQDPTEPPKITCFAIGGQDTEELFDEDDHSEQDDDYRPTKAGVELLSSKIAEALLAQEMQEKRPLRPLAIEAYLDEVEMSISVINQHFENYLVAEVDSQEEAEHLASCQANWANFSEHLEAKYHLIPDAIDLDKLNAIKDVVVLQRQTGMNQLFVNAPYIWTITGEESSAHIINNESEAPLETYYIGCALMVLKDEETDEILYSGVCMSAVFLLPIEDGLGMCIGAIPLGLSTIDNNFKRNRN
jgi:hypothetical protein